MNVHDKRIVIFGGTSGIGLATTSMLSEMNAKHIYSISRNPEKSSLSNSNIELVKMDVLDEEKLVSFFEKIGKYDVLINAARETDSCAIEYTSDHRPVLTQTSVALWALLHRNN